MVAVLFKAGDQVPVMPFVEVNGKGLRLAPAHIGATALNTGTTEGLTLIVMVVLTAH